MRYGLLGPTRVWRADGQQVPVGGAGLRALLVRLLLAAGDPVGTDRLIEDLYGEEPPAGAGNALQSQVSRLRRSLPDGRAVEFHPAGYRLALDPEQVDAHRFARLAAQGRRALADGDHRRADALLREALDLWRGQPLADVARAPFAPRHAARLGELRFGAVCDRAEAQLERDQHAAAITALAPVVEEFPLRERPRAQLMRALAAAGRPADALALFEDGRRLLADRLGADPSGELAAVHRAILRGEPVAAAPSAAVPAPGGPAAAVASGGQAAAVSSGGQAAAVASGGPAAVPAALPGQLTTFVGRGEDLDRLARLLASSRLVTVTGPGGVGKTRLAVEAAGRQPGGAYVVDLAPLERAAGAADLARPVLAALGLRDGGLRVPAGQDPVQRLVAALAGRPALLLVDNCEHVVAAAAELVGRLLTAHPDLRVLATSREPLGITGEALAPLTGLALPPAGAPPDELRRYPSVRLFLDRAAEVAPDAAPDPAVVGHICRTLDGLPLAIELAAARMRTVGVETLAARLDDRFELLSRGSRTAGPRHRTLRAVVEWSWQLLAEPERVLARRLTTFTGGATLAAVEQVVGLPAGTVLDPLTGLVDKSLVELAGGRYRMLETIRAYGAEQLARAGETERLRRAHAAHVLDLAQRADAHLRGGEQLPWLSTLDAERENLHAALRRATAAGDGATGLRLVSALAMYWWLRGQRGEGAALAGDLLAAVGPVPPPGLVEEYALCVLTAGLGSPAGPAAPPAVWSVESVVARLGRPPRQPFLFFLSALATGPPRAGTEETTGMVERSAMLGTDPWSQTLAPYGRGVVHLWNSRYQEAERDLTVARELVRATGERWLAMMVEASLAEVAYARGDPGGAAAPMREALRLAGELESTADLSDLLRTRGAGRLRAGDLAPAEADLRRAVSLAQRAGAPELVAAARHGLAEAAWLGGDLAAARHLVHLALADCPSGWFSADNARADLLLLSARIAEAEGKEASAAQRRRQARHLLAAYPGGVLRSADGA